MSIGEKDDILIFHTGTTAPIEMYVDKTVRLCMCLQCQKHRGPVNPVGSKA